MIRADRGADLCIISIHTPTKGATGDKQELYEDVYKFQSTLPRREQLCHNYITPLYSSISIHTPTKGATLPRICKYRLNENFNPHSHEGSDVLGNGKYKTIEDFNPHSHEGSDHLETGFLRLLYHFNPHSHEGSDCNVIFSADF